MIVDNFNDYHNQSLLLSNIHSFSLWKIYYCYDKNKQQKEKKLNKNLTFMANLEYKISESLPGTWWIFVTLCFVQLWLSSVHTNDGSYLPYVTPSHRRPKTHTLNVWESRGKEWHTASLFQRFLLSLNEMLLIAYFSWTLNLPFHISFWPFLSHFSLLSSIITHNWAFENEFRVEPTYQPTFICLWKPSSTTDTSSHDPF